MRILMMRTDRLGDLILSLPAIYSIQKAYPDAEIEMVVNAHYRSLIEAIPKIHAVHSINTFCWTMQEIFSLVKDLRKKKYDLAINLLPGTDHLSAFLLCVVQAKEKVGYAVGFQKWCVTKKIPPAKEVKYERDLVLDILREIGVKTLTSKLQNPFLERSKERKRCKEHVIIIHPATSSDWRRHWPTAYYQRLVSRVIHEKNNVKILFTGTESENSGISKLIEGINLPQEKKEKLINVAGETSIEELFSLVQSADVVLSPLTSITHIAVALGKPVVTLVGPTPVERWTAKGLPYLVIKKDFTCSPCEHKKGCVYGKENKCMIAIKPEEVYEKMASLLKVLE